MADADGQLDLIDPTASGGELIPAEPLHLLVTFDLRAGEIDFVWTREGGAQVVARGRLLPSENAFASYVLDWRLEFDGKARNAVCAAWPASTVSEVRSYAATTCSESPRLNSASCASKSPNVTATAGE